MRDAPTVFFMHIMKTSGTSLVWSIRRSVPPDEVYPGGPPSPERARRYWLLPAFDDVDDATRARLRVFMGHFPWFANERFGAEEVVTLLRDPVERTISHVAQHQRTHGADGASLEALYEGTPELPFPFRDYQVRQFALAADDDAATVTIDDARFRLARQRLEATAVLGRTDALGPFTAEVERRYGWQPKDARLQVAPDRPDVPAAFRRRVERDNAADVQFYAEACELLRRRGQPG